MKVIVFYSFKGGVGRTLSLLSAAYSLARRGRKVVVADWDLQAPGLSLMDCMLPEGAGPPRRGILEYLTALHPDRWKDGEPAIEDMLLAPGFIDEARKRETADGKPVMKGDLAFIPAGDLGEGVSHFIEAVKRAELHNLNEFLVKLDRDPRMVFKVFREQVESADIAWRGEGLEGPPDYLLVDCRTGITEIGDLVLGDATDFTVIVYGQDVQNLEGLQIVLNASPRQPGDLAANTMLIWSGTVTGQEALKVEQQRRKEQLLQRVCRPDSLGLREPFPREFVVPFNPDLVFSDVPLAHRVPEGEFARLFDEITDFLEQRCLWRENIVEAIIAPVDPGDQTSEQQRRMKIATTPESEKEAHLQQAYTEIELSRGLTQLLFNPPPWNLAGIPTPELVPQWPEGFSSDDEQTLLLQLLAYSVSLTGQEKFNILEKMGSLSAFQVSELLRILSEERRRWIAIEPHTYWQIVRLTVSAGCEWLAMLVQSERVRSAPAKGDRSRKATEARLPEDILARLETSLERLVEGQPGGERAEFSHAAFPLLVGEALRATSTSPPSFLSQWLASRKLESLSLRETLSRKTCAAAEREGLSGPALGYCWERLADVLDDRGRAAEEMEKAGWFDRAIESYERSLKLRPDHAHTLSNLGVALDDRGRVADESEKAGWFDRAIESCERSLKLRPDHADTLYNLGNAVGNRGRVADESEKAGWFDRAIESYERSLRLRPDHAATLDNLGNAIDDRGRVADESEKAGWFDRAIESYERSLKLRPDHADTINNLGNVLDDRGRVADESEKAGWFDRAIESYERSQKLRPDHADTEDNLTATLLRKWRVVPAPAEKESLLTRAGATIERAFARDAPKVRYNFACVLALRGEPDRAVEELRKLLQEDPAKRQEIAKDEDFESLAEHPGFRDLIAES